MYSNGTHETSDVPRSEISRHHVIVHLVAKQRNWNLVFLCIAENETTEVRNVHAAAYITCGYNSAQCAAADSEQQYGTYAKTTKTLSWRKLVYAVMWQKGMLLLCKCHIAAITRSFRSSFLAGENYKYWKRYNWITYNLMNSKSVYLNKLCSAGNVTTVPVTECPPTLQMVTWTLTFHLAGNYGVNVFYAACMPNFEVLGIHIWNIWLIFHPSSSRSSDFDVWSRAASRRLSPGAALWASPGMTRAWPGAAPRAECHPHRDDFWNLYLKMIHKFLVKMAQFFCSSE